MLSEMESRGSRRGRHALFDQVSTKEMLQANIFLTPEHNNQKRSLSGLQCFE